MYLVQQNFNVTQTSGISCHLGNRKESLKYYREALQTATDATLRQFCEAKIGELLSSDWE
jgi:hypothetical protein